MFEAYLQALTSLLQPLSIISMFAGTILGLIIGVLPGIGALAGLTLLLPFVFRMPPEASISMLAALQMNSMTGGALTAILLNIPGETINAPVLLDGYPMMKKGEGVRALGAATTASTASSILPVIAVAGTIPLLLPVLIAFKSPEMTILIVLAMGFIAVLSAKSPVKGLMAGLLGMFLSLIGYHGNTAVFRYTFSIPFLYNGLNIVVIALGIFGVAELFNLSLTKQTAITMVKVAGKLSQAWQGAMDVWHYRWLFLRCTVLGYVVGILPGVGSETSVWIAYGHAKQTSKHPEKFGTGAVEGIIAAQAACNSEKPGAMLTTIAFGIPGSITMVIFLSAFLIMGVVPGPRFLVDDLPLALVIFLGMTISSLIGGIICMLFAPSLGRIAAIHLDYLFPTVMALIVIGAYATQTDVRVLIELVAFGLVGVLFTRFGYPKPTLILGFVLGRLFEDYFWLSYKTAGALFFTSPISLTLLAILVLAFAYPHLKRVVPRLRRRPVRP